MNLYCKDCNCPHDLDMAPDEGTCLICGSDLIEDPIERELVGGRAFTRGIVEVVGNALETCGKKDGDGN